MKKLIVALFFILITVSSFAAEVGFLDNPVWSTVLEKAKKENKIIFLDAYATWCGPCKKMDAETYTNQEAAAYYNDNFINVKYDMEKGEGKMLAERYKVTAYPTLLFIGAEGNLLHKGVGYIEGAEFLSLGKIANDPSNQYYTIKKNALTLNNEDFLKFAAKAVASEDQDYDEIATEYLEKQTDVLANNHLQDLVMNYVNSLPDEKTLTYVVANKTKLLADGRYTKTEVDERIIGLTMGYALSPVVQLDGEEIDYEAIKRITEKFIPEQAFFVYHYFKTQFAIGEKDVDAVLTDLNTLLSNIPAKVSFDQICNAMMGVGPFLAEAGKIEEPLKKFDEIKLTGKDVENAYMKDFVKAIIYIKNKDFEKFKVVANSMITHVGTPEKVKDDLKAALERMN